MSGAVYVNVPQGMSYVNAFYALWSKANKESYEESTDCALTCDKVCKLFEQLKDNVPAYFVNRFENRKLGVGFEQFPKIEVAYYEREHGKQAAMKALEEYSQVESDKHLDQGNSCVLSFSFNSKG